MNQRSDFVFDGLDRHAVAWDRVYAEVQVEVEAEFAEQLAQAGMWERIKLRREIRQEIARRLPGPPDPANLYGKAPRC